MIKDIAPPVNLPIPMWIIIAVPLVILVVLGGLAFLVVRLMKAKSPPALSPRAMALRDLEKLRAQLGTLDPYGFSIAVSDVLRSYIGHEYRLQAVQQTSPEFLAAIAESQRFTDADRQSLGEFLDDCDLIKFARIDATTEDSARLLGSAAAFVQGART